MNFELTDEQRLISESAREFCDREILPRVRENDRAGRFDRELASKLGEVGYLGAPVSEQYGGRGGTTITRHRDAGRPGDRRRDLGGRRLPRPWSRAEVAARRWGPGRG